MSLPVIVTRAEPLASETADTLNKMGFEAVISPMLEIVPLAFRPAAIRKADHLVFTSANGVFATGAIPRRPGVTAWCVGPATAAAAAAYGYQTIIEGPRDADALAALILGSDSRPAGRFVHVANKDAAGRIVAQLKEAGFDAEFLPLYAAEPVRELSVRAQAAAQSGAPFLVLIHSAKGAEALARLKVDLSHAGIAAISDAALAPLKGRAGLGEWVASDPREAALMQAVEAARAAIAG